MEVATLIKLSGGNGAARLALFKSRAREDQTAKLVELGRRLARAERALTVAQRAMASSRSAASVQRMRAAAGRYDDAVNRLRVAMCGEDLRTELARYNTDGRQSLGDAWTNVTPSTLRARLKRSEARMRAAQMKALREPDAMAELQACGEDYRKLRSLLLGRNT